jgi:CubicO group peptidase (beta-lactamase class C family)
MMERIRCWVAVATIASALVSAPAAAAPRPAPVGIWADSIARRAMATGLTPGMSVAVVAEGRVVWRAGFGHADRDSRREVTPSTRFYIASTSKALTALAAARLAARGALDLDAPLSRALPAAVFAPGIAADSILVRDLLTHTHGISAEGPVSMRVAFTGEYTNEELLRALAAHPPARSGRAFQYSNLGYDLLGVVLDGGVRGGWREVVEREVTRPLGMTATTAYRSRVPDDSLAGPSELGPEGLEPIRLAKEDANMGPAGGHFSTATDLARLVLAELQHGRLDGRQVIERDLVATTQRLHAAQDREFGPYHRHGWGLGWDLGTYDGDTLVHRFGSFAGYRSHVSFMPGRGLGVVVLVNGGGAASTLTDAVACAIYDRMLGRPDSSATRLTDRLAATVEQARSGRAAMAADRDRRAARSQVLPLPLEAYAGTYAHPHYGTLELRRAAGRLEAVMGVARSAVEVYDAANHQLRVELFGGGVVLRAIVGEDGRSIAAVEMRGARYSRR